MPDTDGIALPAQDYEQPRPRLPWEASRKIACNLRRNSGLRPCLALTAPLIVTIVGRQIVAGCDGFMYNRMI